MPPPRVNPPSPVDETSPPVVARPWICVAASNPAHLVPPPATARQRVGVHLDCRHRRQVDDDAIVAGGETSDAVCSAPDGHRQALARREANGPDNVGGAGGTDDHCRVLVDRAVPDVPGLLVLIVAGSHERADESPLELVDGRVAE